MRAPCDFGLLQTIGRFDGENRSDSTMSCRLLECLDAIEKRVELLRQAVQSLEVEKDSLVEILRRFSDSPELQTVSVDVIFR